MYRCPIGCAGTTSCVSAAAVVSARRQVCGWTAPVALVRSPSSGHLDRHRQGPGAQRQPHRVVVKCRTGRTGRRGQRRAASAGHDGRGPPGGRGRRAASDHARAALDGLDAFGGELHRTRSRILDEVAVAVADGEGTRRFDRRDRNDPSGRVGGPPGGLASGLQPSRRGVGRGTVPGSNHRLSGGLGAAGLSRWTRNRARSGRTRPVRR